jgi:hypothetical protein
MRLACRILSLTIIFLLLFMWLSFGRKMLELEREVNGLWVTLFCFAVAACSTLVSWSHHLKIVALNEMKPWQLKEYVPLCKEYEQFVAKIVDHLKEHTRFVSWEEIMVPIRQVFHESLHDMHYKRFLNQLRDARWSFLKDEMQLSFLRWLFRGIDMRSSL